MKAVLNRFFQDEKETLGILYLYEGLGALFSCGLLELPWEENKQNISCIPAGKYILAPRSTQERGNHLEVKNVEGRSSILIHRGNYVSEIKGCQEPGLKFGDINKDGIIDVLYSKTALKQLVNLIRAPIVYYIFDCADGEIK